MLGAIVRFLFLILALRLVAGVWRALRRRAPERERFTPDIDPSRVKKRDIAELTPYEIEDAEYEELPPRNHGG